ncbi:uncharacterized protein LOC116992072 isoform X2 [Catharus ustulatus]|uniref:uncharacterized protein LOC116992072 isoform X2 n=1 Tax=Catharus ustulatus TaxID=91951 RepID=UPI00140CFEAD|nr:uncharacterized protein LOC116992072 isoform X2 [Catharus ustulatus]
MPKQNIPELKSECTLVLSKSVLTAVPDAVPTTDHGTAVPDRRAGVGDTPVSPAPAVLPSDHNTFSCQSLSEPRERRGAWFTPGGWKSASWTPVSRDAVSSSPFPQGGGGRRSGGGCRRGTRRSSAPAGCPAERRLPMSVPRGAPCSPHGSRSSTSESSRGRAAPAGAASPVPEGPQFQRQALLLAAGSPGVASNRAPSFCFGTGMGLSSH